MIVTYDRQNIFIVQAIQWTTSPENIKSDRTNTLAYFAQITGTDKNSL
jgi:hypothetical protein